METVHKMIWKEIGVICSEWALNILWNEKLINEKSRTAYQLYTKGQ